MKIRYFISILTILHFNATGVAQLNTGLQLQYCSQQAEKTLASLDGFNQLPRSIPKGAKEWRLVGYKDWCSGFWPGILWYNYEFTKRDEWRVAAEAFSKALFPLADTAAIDHDLGFQVFCSIGNGYRLTGNTAYKDVLLKAADRLSNLFSPRVGTILSWPRKVQGVDYPFRHNTIMDNMINLELLFWASKHGGGKGLYSMAQSHAVITMKNHFRDDYTSYHVVVYDTATGKKVKGLTHQGYADSSMWSRGQAWAIYGFTMVYRETKDTSFLNFVQKVADVYLEKLPPDLIPYWDFDDPGVPHAPKDASAAAIVASGLLELSTLLNNKEKARFYRAKAEQMLSSLSSGKYRANTINTAFLLHSTGHKPNGGEVDTSIIYADYYYLEALLRLRKMEQGKSIYEKL